MTVYDLSNFAHRHLGPRESGLSEMLDALGYDSLDALTTAAMPENIVQKEPLVLPDALRGRSLGPALVKRGVEDARAEGEQIVAEARVAAGQERDRAVREIDLAASMLIIPFLQSATRCWSMLCMWYSDCPFSIYFSISSRRPSRMHA